MSKGTSWDEVMLNSEKIKPVALAVIELCLSEGISQSVTQSVTRKFCLINSLLKFHINLLKVFRVNLKACLGLVLPNQYCFIVVREK